MKSSKAKINYAFYRELLKPGKKCYAFDGYNFRKSVHRPAIVVRLHIVSYRLNVESIKTAVEYIRTAKIQKSYLPLTYWALDKKEDEYAVTNIRYYGSGLPYAKAVLRNRRTTK